MTDSGPTMKGVQPVWQRAVDEHLGLLRYWRSPAGNVGGQVLAAGRHGQRAQEFWREHPEFDPGQAFTDALLAGDEERATAILKRSQEAQDRLEGKRFDRDREGAEVAQEQLTAVQDAATWAVTEDMMTLVRHASTSMPMETIEAVDLPCPNAFVYLGEPVWMTTSNGQVPHRALHWQAEGYQIKVVCYSARGLYGEHERPLSARGLRALAPSRKQSFTARYDALIAAALAANPDPPGGRKRDALERRSYNLAVAFQTHKRSIPAFMHNLAISATNNQAERDLRPVKLHRLWAGRGYGLPRGGGVCLTSSAWLGSALGAASVGLSYASSAEPQVPRLSLHHLPPSGLRSQELATPRASPPQRGNVLAPRLPSCTPAPQAQRRSPRHSPQHSPLLVRRVVSPRRIPSGEIPPKLSSHQHHPPGPGTRRSGPGCPTLQDMTGRQPHTPPAPLP